jgi:hypothetical protein
MAFGNSFRALVDSSAAVLIASYPKTAKNTTDAPAKTPAHPKGRNGV